MASNYMYLQLFDYTMSYKIFEIGRLNNRLSGSIPAVFIALPDVRILEGNQFSCNVDRSDLPEFDPQVDSYGCGSDNVNNSFIEWSVILISLSLLSAILFRYHATIRSMIETLW